MNSAQLLALGCVAGFIAGGTVEYALLHRAVAAETAAPAVRQQDSSLVLTRAPDPKAKPAHLIPTGATLERTVSVTVQPRAETSAATNSPLVQSTPIASDTIARALFVDGRETEPPRAISPVPCPPVTVQLSLIRLADQTHRVIASSPDGVVIAGLDVPVANTMPPPKVLKWSAGPLYGTGVAWGGFIARDLGPAHAWGALAQGPKGQRGEAIVGVGWRF